MPKTLQFNKWSKNLVRAMHGNGFHICKTLKITFGDNLWPVVLIELQGA